MMIVVSSPARQTGALCWPPCEDLHPPGSFGAVLPTTISNAQANLGTALVETRPKMFVAVLDMQKFENDARCLQADSAQKAICTNAEQVADG